MALRRKPLRWLLAWRTEYDHGMHSYPSEIQARWAMREFDKPKSWAAVIDPYKFVFVAEAGTRFGAPKRKAASAEVAVLVEKAG